MDIVASLAAAAYVRSGSRRASSASFLLSSPFMSLPPAHRWHAPSVIGKIEGSADGAVCATIWPTRSLQTRERWFDELYVWTDGFEPSPVQWSRIQLFGLRRALGMLEREECKQIAVTLSFGTVQKYDERIDTQLRAHALVAHRLSVILRGSVEMVRSHYRIRAFIDYLRAQQIPVGLRVTAPRLAMDLSAFALVQPDFAKILAPTSNLAEAWQNLALEARVVGLSEQWLIVAGLQAQDQVERAAQAGIGFGQGNAVRPAQRPFSEIS
ncbi:MAG TPA: hypothetical protein VEI29_03310, partial [Burkholderiaceae bacterium]|nr:hypothetical protein [Burkholderiaceae bacterium]